MGWGPRIERVDVDDPLTVDSRRVIVNFRERTWAHLSVDRTSTGQSKQVLFYLRSYEFE